MEYVVIFSGSNMKGIGFENFSCLHLPIRIPSGLHHLQFPQFCWLSMFFLLLVGYGFKLLYSL